MGPLSHVSQEAGHMISSGKRERLQILFLNKQLGFSGLGKKNAEIRSAVAK